MWPPLTLQGRNLFTAWWWCKSSLSTEPTLRHHSSGVGRDPLVFLGEYGRETPSSPLCSSLAWKTHLPAWPSPIPTLAEVWECFSRALQEWKSRLSTWPLPGMAGLGSQVFFCGVWLEERSQLFTVHKCSILLGCPFLHPSAERTVCCCFGGFCPSPLVFWGMPASSALCLGYVMKKEAQGTDYHVVLWISRSLVGLPSYQCHFLFILYITSGGFSCTLAEGLKKNTSTPSSQKNVPLLFVCIISSLLTGFSMMVVSVQQWYCSLCVMSLGSLFVEVVMSVFLISYAWWWLLFLENQKDNGKKWLMANQ